MAENSGLRVIRIPEDPDVPRAIAGWAFRMAARDRQSVLIVSDDFVILPHGMPGGHRMFEREPASYCTVCKHFSAGGDTC